MADDSPYGQLEREKAAHETVKREEREFKLAILRGQYVPRVAVQQASATVFAMVTQALRSLPDSLEREFGLAPEVVEVIAREIDASLDSASKTLETLTVHG